MSKLTPAQREQLSAECFELSLEGLSLREIGRRKGLSHPTVSNLISEESTRRRKQAEDHLQKSLAMKMKVVERLWSELHNNPSSHATANLGHALRGLLSDLDKLTGVIPPSQVHHKMDVQVVLNQALRNWVPRLNDDELQMLYLLACKAEGGDIPEETDVVRMAFERYSQQGTLKKSEPEIIEVIPEEW